MKTFFFQIFGLIILIALAAFFAFNSNYLASLTAPFVKNTPRASAKVTAVAKKDLLKIAGPDGLTKAELEIEVANTKELRSKGLGYRQSLASGSGMLFLHENTQKYTYWMKGMEFPIDIIWISDNTIADFIPNVLPPVEGQTDDTLERYSSTVAVNKVLETNAGFISQNNIQKGDKIIVNSN